MTLCLGPGGPKVLFWYMFSYAKGEKLGPGGHSPQGPLDLLLYIYNGGALWWAIYRKHIGHMSATYDLLLIYTIYPVADACECICILIIITTHIWCYLRLCMWCCLWLPTLLRMITVLFLPLGGLMSTISTTSNSIYILLAIFTLFHIILCHFTFLFIVISRCV